MSSVFSGSGASTDPDIATPDTMGQFGVHPAPPGKPHRGVPEEQVLHLAALGNIERELRRIRSFTAEFGRQSVKQDGGPASAGGLIEFVFEGPKSGADWYIERVGVSAAGASAAGVVSLFATGLVAGAPDESEFLDVLGALTGNSPSRGVLDGKGTPYFVYGGRPITVQVSGVVANAQVQVRVQYREVLSGADPALRAQNDY